MGNVLQPVSDIVIDTPLSISYIYIRYFPPYIIQLFSFINERQNLRGVKWGGRLRCALGDDGWLLLFRRICLLWFFSAATPPAFFLFFFVNLICVFAWKECVLLAAKRDDGYFGTGEISRGDSRSSVLSLFYIVWNPFSNLRNGMALAFFRSPFFVILSSYPYVSPLNQSTEKKKLSYSPPLRIPSLNEYPIACSFLHAYIYPMNPNP